MVSNGNVDHHTLSPSERAVVREFFRGWRRKAGLVTLAMALVLIGICLRGFVVLDSFYWQCDSSYHEAHSFAGVLYWLRSPDEIDKNRSLRWVSDEIDESLHSPWLWLADELQYERQWKFAGFSVEVFTWNGNGLIPSLRFRVLAVPYWSLVLPLTLLSAWLLLTKPRPAKSAKESNHA